MRKRAAFWGGNGEDAGEVLLPALVGAEEEDFIFFDGTRGGAAVVVSAEFGFRGGGGEENGLAERNF